MAECLAKVKAAMGPNAVILHTRTYHRRTCCYLRKREYVEITAGQGIEGLGAIRPRRVVRDASVAVVAPVTKTAVSASRAPQAAQIAGYIDSPVALAPAVARSLPGRELLNTPAAGGVMATQVARDVDELKRLVSGLVDTIHKKDAPNVPEELFDFYMKLVQNHVDEELAGDIMRPLRKQIRTEHLTNAAFVRDKIVEHIEKLIPTAGPIARKKPSGPHVVALIGPTGVGKTTTIAKLAADLKLNKNQRVGLITLDTYRIAAIDQLKKFATILEVVVRVVGSSDDVREAVASMADCDYILIDTAGRSPRDSMKISELKNMLGAAGPDEVHLVLSATASDGCVELAIEKFGDVRFDKVIFTKLDEASSVGVVLNVVTKLNKPLSYVTTGQDVPNDIEVGDGRKLAMRVLDNAT
jgi:flagellar biosynthesis protein FlhF